MTNDTQDTVSGPAADDTNETTTPAEGTPESSTGGDAEASTPLAGDDGTASTDDSNTEEAAA